MLAKILFDKKTSKTKFIPVEEKGDNYATTPKIY